MTHEEYFAPFRRNVIGIEAKIPLPGGGTRPLVYADWIASGRLYRPLENYLLDELGPLVANTHTETTYTGTAMTRAYQEARQIIKDHVHAGPGDSLFLAGFGMTAAINKLQRILGLRLPEECMTRCPLRRDNRQDKPLVIITHMEHHSNQISWEDCWADVAIIPREERTGQPSLAGLEELLKSHKDRRRIIGSFTACSNVTGIITPYHKMATLVHRYGGVCFVDFAASAPYESIDMHPADPEEGLDGIMFSPHKFLGGPGSSGVLIMSDVLYHRRIPDQPGGGTVLWTTPFGTHEYAREIEVREDGGTPGFLQAVRASLAIKIKEAMGVERIRAREAELKALLQKELSSISDIYLLEPQAGEPRLGILSFYGKGAHHNLVVKLLNDRFGIQTRGGCSCAGTYGHILFHIQEGSSRRITDMIDRGDLSEKPGWVRISLHPVMTDEEVRYIGRAVAEVMDHYEEWKQDYEFCRDSGEFCRKGISDDSSGFALSSFKASPQA